jgi:hypothetical protein
VCGRTEWTLSGRRNPERIITGEGRGAFPAIAGEFPISKIENATQLPAIDIKAWATACGADHEIPDLIAQVRNIDSMYTEWRRLET